MAMRRKNKVIAQFNMSSLTDIIFLLLIFFMLTSSLVVPNALNLKLPGSSTTSAVTTKPNSVSILRDGSYRYNGRSIARDPLYNTLRDLKRQSGGVEVNLIVSPHPSASNQYVVDVLDMAYNLKINAILTEPK
jgi:biopolymer transport protein ExbD